MYGSYISKVDRKLIVLIFLMILVLSIFGTFIGNSMQIIYTEGNPATSYNPIVSPLLKEKKFYILSENTSFDNLLKLRFIDAGITVIFTSVFNKSVADQAFVIIVSINWLVLQKPTVIKSIETILFDGHLVFFYGSLLSRLYDVINTDRVQKTFTAYVISPTDRNEFRPYIPEDVILFGIQVPSPDYTQQRQYTRQFYLSGDLSIDDIAESIIEWTELLVSLNSRSSVAKNSEKTISDIRLYGWDKHIATIYWKTTTIKDNGQNAAKLEVLVDYWYHADMTNPNRWHYFLVHSKYINKPLLSYITPYKARLKVDCDTAHFPGQKLYDWGPKNWGGPTNNIDFSVAMSEGSASADINFSFELKSISWSDLSDPALGIHETEFTFISHYKIPYGLTATIEQASIYIGDSMYYGGALPLTLSHYYLSQFGIQYSGLLEGSISFSVALY